MPLSDEGESADAGGALDLTSNKSNMMNVETQFRNLCCELNLDTETTEDAWSCYCSTKTSYTLEGEQLHWLACALYDACRKGTVPTVGSQEYHQGNCVSLTRLLRSAKLSLLQFFNKARKWADMTHKDKESAFREKIDKLESNFSVSYNIFKKYQPIFIDLFKDPSDDPPKVNRSRKSKRPPCTPGELFDFIWTLFIKTKASFPSISDDLVNSYHLLLATCDYVYCNAWLEKRDDLLNPDFMSRPADQEESETSPCIIDKLCMSHDGITNEVKVIRWDYLIDDIKKSFQSNKLSGNTDTMMGVLESSVFDSNYKNIKRDYELHVLSIGEYDERVFLGDDANEEIGTPTKRPVAGDLETGLNGRRNLQDRFSMNRSIVPNTPLSGRNYIKAKEEMMTTPNTSLTYLVQILNRQLSGRKDEPSTNLKTLLTKFSSEAKIDWVTGFVDKMGEIFISQYNTDNDCPNSFANQRLKKINALFFKLLENVIIADVQKQKPVGGLLDKEEFYETLYIASLEIVIFSYSSPTKCFPWAMETFKVEPFHFYKIIEILIKLETGMARDVIKHLQHIEEQILERFAWKESSPFWRHFTGLEGVPSSEQVSLPQDPSLTQSPVSHFRSRPFMSPTPANDRFQSPTVVRQIFRSEADNTTNDTLPPPAQPAPNVPKGVLLFFRKVYHLTDIRLETMCNSFQLPHDICRIAYTCFEWIIMHHCEVLKDRHLDQILMCVIYLICKIRNHPKAFTDILSHYKTYQPQADSHVYRSVLLDKQGSGAEQSSGDTQAMPPPTPSRMACSSSVTEGGEVRGDLIKFYNAVFLELSGLRDYALRFGIKKENQPPLSPRPKLRASTMSPRKRVSERSNIFTQPLTNSLQLNSPGRTLTYTVSMSPAKDLKAINDMVRNSAPSVSNPIKRKLTLDDEEGDTSNNALIFPKTTKQE